MMLGLALLAVMATPGTAVDPIIQTGVRVVLYRRHMPADQEAAAEQALYDAAQSDRRVADDLRFVALEANCLTSVRNADGNIFTMLETADYRELADFRELGKLFYGDGVLSGVRYEWSHDEGERIVQKARASFAKSAEATAVWQEYDRHRDHGDTPEEAAKALSTMKKHLEAGVEAIGAPIESLGELMFRSYSDEDSDDDFMNFLEAHYAMHHPGAKDILAVTPAEDPIDYMSQKVLTSMFMDEGIMMTRINRVVRTAIDSAGQRPTAPVPTISAPSGPLPKADSLGYAGLPRDADQLSEIVRDAGGKQCERSIIDPYDPEKCRKTFVFDGSNEEAMAWITPCWKVQSDAYGSSFDCNATYDVTFAPWYFANVDGAAFLCSLPPINSEPYRSQVPLDGRVYLPASPGRPVEVTIRVRTDASGRMKIGIVPVAPCAFSIGRVWVRRVQS